MELSTMTTRERQQRNTTVTQFDSSDLFGRRPEEYEGTLIVLTAQLLCILNELRCHFQGIAEEFERDMDWFEESSTQPIVTIARNGEVGTPWLALAREQLETYKEPWSSYFPVSS